MLEVDYPVGGSLSRENPFYVQRQADQNLFEALQVGQFCYVFTSRQMGKSSLLVRSRQQMEQLGRRCCSLDLTSIGSETPTPEQWYKGVAFELWRGFALRRQFDFRTWWQQEADLSVLQRLQRFISEVLLSQWGDQSLVIFVDEIDTVLGLPFAVDDFFALIRFCSNQRALDSRFKRLTFVLSGVATPADLVRDPQRTPFNIGRAIELTGFDYAAAAPLLQGLESVISQADQVLKEILAWTAGQPFLTQKLCQLVVDTARSTPRSSPAAALTLPPGTAALWVEELVQTRVLQHWEAQDEPEHLRTLRDRMVHGGQRAGRLLGLYQRILQGQLVQASDSRDQVDLLLSGLVVKSQGQLVVKNAIYLTLFDAAWVEAQLTALRPYTEAFTAWTASNRLDASRLLRSQALQEAQRWSQGKSLSDADYQFLAASQASDRAETQQALEAARLQEVEARLGEEQRRRRQEGQTARFQRLLLAAVSLALLIALSLGLTLRQQYQAAIQREQSARISEIQALIASSESLFASDRRLDALMAALRAQTQLSALTPRPPDLPSQVELVLQQAISGADEYNRLAFPAAGLNGLAFGANGANLVAAGQDNTLNLWSSDGHHRRTLEGHSGPVLALAVQDDRVVTGSSDRTLRLWSLDGTFFQTLRGHQGSILAVALSPDGQLIASGSDDTTIKLWRWDGTLIRTLQGHRGAVTSLVFAPNGQLLSSGDDGSIHRWSLDGDQLLSFQDPSGAVRRLALSPLADRIATASDDQAIRIWSWEGALLATLRGHNQAVNAVAFSPDGTRLASASSDHTVKLWTRDGDLLRTFAGHTAAVTEVAFSPGGYTLASLGGDRTLRLWNPQNRLLQPLVGHSAGISSLAFSRGGTQLATASSDRSVRLWQLTYQPELRATLQQTLKGFSASLRAVTFSPRARTLLSKKGQNLAIAGSQTITLASVTTGQRLTFVAHASDIRDLAFSPDGRWLASASTDNTIKVWVMQSLAARPPLLATLRGHQSGIFALAFSPDSQVIASASADSTVKLWTPDGRFLSTFEGHQRPVWSVAFSPDSQVLASGSDDQTVRIWRLNGTVAQVLHGHTSGIRAVAFSPDGQLLASGSSDGTIKLWQRNGTLLTTLKGHQSSVQSLAFSPDGRLLASASDDRSAILWDLQQVRSFEQVLAYSCTWVKDYLNASALATSAETLAICPPP